MGRAYKNPTEDMALGHIILEEKKKRRREMRKKNRSPGTHNQMQNNGRPRTSVWRDEATMAISDQAEVISHEGK